MNSTLVMLDLEFTGLHQYTTPISIGAVAMDGNSFYGEFTDYDVNQVDDWIGENVIPHLLMTNPSLAISADVGVIGTQEEVAFALLEWLSQYDSVELWGDLKDYDMVLFNQLFGGAMNKPINVYYISYDICTLFKVKGIDPDISREEFISNSVQGTKHNALYDARVIKACYEKLINMN